MYVATIATYRNATNPVVVVDNSEAMSLETMTAMANLDGVVKTRRVVTDRATFVAYAFGRHIEAVVEVIDGKETTVVRPV